ncbi:hypothetical protein KAU11_10360 [Candidatus Babeliales bacterium]|nr:hypothetical protein [Candidatus Babeliales bacterium]
MKTARLLAQIIDITIIFALDVIGVYHLFIQEWIIASALIGASALAVIAIKTEDYSNYGN